MPQQPVALQLEAIATRVHGLAFDFADDRRQHSVTEQLIDEVEQVAADLRAVVRGR